MRRTRQAPTYVAAAVLIGVLAIAGVIDAQARSAHRMDARAAVSALLDDLARNLDDVVARESSGVDALAALVEISKDEPQHLRDEFALFAASLLSNGETVRSVQIAPDARLEYVYPLEGNEAAVGLDLLADPDRQRLLAPSIVSGQTVFQGPVELVQGGYGIIVRRPMYNDDGTFWGFVAIVLDWPVVVQRTQVDHMEPGVVAGVRIADLGVLAAGVAEAFEGDPEIRSIALGISHTEWELAARPTAGWPATSPATGWIWAIGLMVASTAAFSVHWLMRRPEALRRDREQIRNELAFAEARYRTTFQNAAAGVAITNVRGHILSANPALHRILGASDDTALKGGSVGDWIHEDDLHMVVQAARRLNLGAREVEYELRTATNEERWIRLVASTIEGSRNDRLFVAVVEDITSRRETERVIADSEARFRQLFENAPIAIQREDYTLAVREFTRLRAQGVSDLRLYLSEDPNRARSILELVRIIDANPAANQLQGHLEKDGGASPTLLDRTSEPSLEGFIETLVAVWEGEQSLEHSVQTVSADGSALHLDVRWSAPMVDGQPDYSRMMVTIADITELREIENQLQELIRSKDRFVASVAHELRTPLTAVVGFAHELKDDLHLYSDREKEDFRDLIAVHSTELSNLIEDLLVWARGDIGEVTIRMEKIDLGEGVRRSLAGVGDYLPVDEPDGPIIVTADPGRLRQIVRNLATNALRYGGDEIGISVRQDNGHAVIDVSDDGPPLATEDHERIFEPYARSENSPTMPGSLGLGLSVSRTLARLQGGDLVCVREDERNVFRVTFPVFADEHVATSTSAAGSQLRAH